MAYTTDDFVTDLRRDSFLAASQSSWTPTKILAVADKMVLRRIVPAFMGIGDGFYREESDITLVASTFAYDFPRYAMFNKIHEAYLVDTSGKLQPLLRKDPVDKQIWNALTAGIPLYIMPEGSQMLLNPTPSASAILQYPTLRVWLYRRPGRMVPTTSAAQVLSVDTNTGIVTYTGTKPSTTFTASSTHDFYRGYSPFRRIGSAISATASGSTTTHTFSTTNAALLTAGDWVCVQDETVFPPVSIEAAPFLEELVISSISKSQKDGDAQAAAMKEIVDDMMTTVVASANRFETMPKVASLRHSPFARGFRGRGMNSTRS